MDYQQSPSPYFYFANSWQLVAGVRWADRIGKGIRTAPRDALVADSVTKETRGLAFGFHRAMDTAGAMLGLLIAAIVVWLVQAMESQLIQIHLSNHRSDQYNSGIFGSHIPGGWGKRCRGNKPSRCAEIFAAQHGEAFYNLPGHREHLHPGELIGCLSGPARSKSGHLSHGHFDDAGGLQSGLFAGINSQQVRVQTGLAGEG